jgi:hypothetical protein
MRGVLHSFNRGSALDPTHKMQLYRPTKSEDLQIEKLLAGSKRPPRVAHARPVRIGKRRGKSPWGGQSPCISPRAIESISQNDAKVHAGSIGSASKTLPLDGPRSITPARPQIKTDQPDHEQRECITLDRTP